MELCFCVISDPFLNSNQPRTVGKLVQLDAWHHCPFLAPQGSGATVGGQRPRLDG